MMFAFASGWNVIFSRKTLEEQHYDLRKVVNIPGTGPFKTQRRVENEVCVMEKNPNYWNKGLPYLDGIEFYNLLPFSPELGSAILSGRVDYARALDPATARKAVTTPGLSTAKFYQSVIHATWLNVKRKPSDDPRVRRAMHLLFDEQVLVDVVKDVSPLMTGPTRVTAGSHSLPLCYLLLTARTATGFSRVSRISSVSWRMIKDWP
jgi:peptide/nickel transport system substrate-binding protein